MSHPAPPEPPASETASPGVVLIGYRGSGKSAAGTRLAKKLGKPFLDTDAAVQARFGGRDAAEIFAAPGLGEPAFRAVEAVVVAEAVAAAESGTVVATGGGAVTESPAARAALRNARVLRVYLHADPAVLSARIAADTKNKRPGLTRPDADPAAEVNELLARRDPHYRETADRVLEVGERTIEEVVEALADLLRERK